MSKLVVIPSNINDLKTSLFNCDAFIIGLKNYSTNFNFYLTIDELKELIPIIKKQKKQIFVSLNKIFHNDDLLKLELILKQLKELSIDGLLFYDIGLFHLVKRLKIDIPLIWNQTHLVTNYYTCNFWYNKGVSAAILSNEITLEEIKEIKQHTKMPIMVCVFGFLPMFFSKRKLISSYFEHIKEPTHQSKYYLHEGNRHSNYPIIEDKLGTSIFSDNVLNGLDELPFFIDNKIDYLIINGFNIESKILQDIVDIFSKVLHDPKGNPKILSEKINQLLPFPTDKGFYYKETIYKVKADE